MNACGQATCRRCLRSRLRQLSVVANAVCEKGGLGARPRPFLSAVGPWRVNVNHFCDSADEKAILWATDLALKPLCVLSCAQRKGLSVLESIRRLTAHSRHCLFLLLMDSLCAISASFCFETNFIALLTLCFLSALCCTPAPSLN